MSGVEHALRFENYSKTRPGHKDRPSGRGAGSGRVGPSRLQGQVGPVGRFGASGSVRAEWGWGGVGHALGRLGPGYKDRPSGAGSARTLFNTRPWLLGEGLGRVTGRFGRVGPRRAG